MDFCQYVECVKSFSSKILELKLFSGNETKNSGTKLFSGNETKSLGNGSFSRTKRKISMVGHVNPFQFQKFFRKRKDKSVEQHFFFRERSEKSRWLNVKSSSSKSFSSKISELKLFPGNEKSREQIFNTCSSILGAHGQQ